MVRFKDGTPTKVWLSQHANGEAFTFKALEKDTTGKRVRLIKTPLPTAL